MSFTLNEIQSKVIELFADGYSNSEVQQETGLGEHTIALVLRSTMEALDAKTMLHAVALYISAKNEDSASTSAV